MSRLFDIAAFSETPRIRADQRDTTLKQWRSWLRHGVFFDASSAMDAYEAWGYRCGDMKDELLVCNPPWQDVFVYGGFLEGGEIGVQTHITEPTPSILASAPDPGGRNARWVVQSRVWQTMDDGTVLVLPEDYLYLSDKGKLLSVGRSMLAAGLGEMLMTAFPFFVFQLLHCRGVTAEPQEPYKPRLPRGKRRKIPRVTFQRLQIGDPNIQRQPSEPTGDHGVAKHLCRGSFAHYTPEAPLFGKYTGVFWRPAHIKGKAEHGIRGKEYEMAGVSEGSNDGQ